MCVCVYSWPPTVCKQITLYNYSALREPAEARGRNNGAVDTLEGTPVCCCNNSSDPSHSVLGEISRLSYGFFPSSSFSVTKQQVVSSGG